MWFLVLSGYTQSIIRSNDSQRAHLIWQFYQSSKGDFIFCPLLPFFQSVTIKRERERERTRSITFHNVLAKLGVRHKYYLSLIFATSQHFSAGELHTRTHTLARLSSLFKSWWHSLGIACEFHLSTTGTRPSGPKHKSGLSDPVYTTNFKSTLVTCVVRKLEIKFWFCSLTNIVWYEWNLLSNFYPQTSFVSETETTLKKKGKEK